MVKKGDVVMRKFSPVLILVLLVMAVYLCSCKSGGIIDAGDPITPLPELKEGTVDPKTNAITITKDNITVTVEHWSRYRLNRKFTTVDMRSPFYYLETWEQAFQSEAFYVTIKNDTPRPVVVNFTDTALEDDRKYVYKPLGVTDFVYKFQTKKRMDLKTKRGLDEASRILLNEAIGPKKEVAAGQVVSGYLAFMVPSSQATKVWLTLVLEKAPEVATAAYERVSLRFDFVQDLVRRKTQPAVPR